MDKGKGVYRYGRLGYLAKYLLRWARYGMHWAGLLPLQVLAALVLILGMAGTLRFGLMFGLMILRGGNLSLNGYLLILVNLIVNLGLLAGSTWFFSYVKFTAPKGHIMKPVLLPLENPLLPDAQLLMRASAVTEAQPQELLRAAQEEPNVRPEELLRIVEQ